MGIPRVHFLRHHPELSQISKVWPFETGFTPSPLPNKGPFILHTEIWPGIVHDEVKQIQSANRNVIRDQAQVYAMCQWARNFDGRGELGSLFEKPDGLEVKEERVCIEEEGWILGA